jgi:MFS family permease
MLLALRVRDFRWLCGARLVSAVGSWLLVVAVPAYVLTTTGSLRATGLVLAAEYLPFLLLGPAAGVLADRLDRRRLLIAADLVRAGAVSALLAAGGRTWVIYLALLVENAATVAARPAMQAQVPAVVGTGPQLSSASALSAVTDATVRLVGGPLGAVLLVLVGFRALVYVDVASYLLSAAAIARTRSRGRPTGAGEHPSFIAGLRLLGHYPLIRALLPATGGFLLANAALSALLVPLGIQHLGGATATGLVLSALGAGFLAGAPLLPVLIERVAAGPLLSGAQAATAIGLAGLMNARSVPLAIAAATAVGISGSLVLNVPPTLVQRTVPGSALGRVTAAFGIIEAAVTLLGAVTAGLLAQAVGLDTTVNAAVILAAGAAVLTAITVPRQGNAHSGTGPRPRPARRARRPGRPAPRPISTGGVAPGAPATHWSPRRGSVSEPVSAPADPTGSRRRRRRRRPGRRTRVAAR